MARFVLVHGAFGGEWVWEEIRERLEQAGHEVETFDLPGGGEDTTPPEGITLDACATRVCEALAAGEEPAVLVGHSMGGAVITEAAARMPEQVDRMIYTCAFLPGDGVSLLDLTSLPEGEGDQVQANITIEGEPPIATMPAEASKGAFYGRTDEEVAARGISRQRPQAVAVFATPVSAPDDALDEIDRYYVHTTEDRSIPPALQLRMANEAGCVEVAELEADHMPQFSRPDELAAILDRFAGA